MIKTLSHKIFSLVLAILVLLSTFSFKMETHFCGSNIVDVAVFSKVKSCCKSETTATSKPQLTKKSCCSNKVVSIDGLKQFKIVPFLKEFSTAIDFSTPPIFNFESDLFICSLEKTIQNYIPPDPALDFQVHYQVFLI
jgi:hypothetical protein